MGKRTNLISYFGGKANFQSYISPIIPKDFKTYTEPFAGSMAVYFFIDMPENAKARYNDFNKDQVNLVACSKEYDKFLIELNKQLTDVDSPLYCKETDPVLVKAHYKELYYKLKKSNFPNESFNVPDFTRASYYAFLLTSAFSSCSYLAAGFSNFKLNTLIRKLQNKQLQEKLSKIDSFENLDFEEFIKKYDSEDTYMYLDPPYSSWKEETNVDNNNRSGWYGTKDAFGQAEHIKLLELLKTTKSRWSLSYYYFPDLEKYLPKDKYVWLEKEYFRSSASFSKTEEAKGKELLILNYQIDPNVYANYRLEDGIYKISEKVVDKADKSKNIDVQIKSLREEWNRPITQQKLKVEDDADDFLNNISETKEQKNIIKEIIKTKTKDNSEVDDFLDDTKEVKEKIENTVKKDEEIDDFWL